MMHDHDGEIARWGECLTCVRSGSRVLSQPGPTPDFDGATYRRDRDLARLTGQLRRVADALSDGRWWTLAALSSETRDPEASISARIRDLRKGKFGGWTVVAENLGAGLWRYRLVTAATLAATRDR